MMILGVLQARVSSSRLPGKVLAPILGRAMILRQIERLSRCRRLNRLVVATSADPSDDALAELCAAEGIAVSRGSLDDVLARVMAAARPFAPDWLVRLTGDCPLADPAVIDRVIDATLAADVDYGTNAVEPTWPDGLDVEVVRMAVLQAIAAEPRTTAEREHVTLAIHRRPDRFRLLHVKGEADLSHLRWTVDEPRDLDLVRRIYGALYPVDPAFDTAAVLALLEREPELVTLNRDIVRNEGLAKSLAAERPAD